MLNFLEKNFPSNKHYLVKLTRQDQIDSFLLKNFYQKTQIKYNKGSRGEIIQTISIIGKKFGWVSDHIPIRFFGDTVISEIAEAFANSNNRMLPSDDEIKYTRYLLQFLNITYLELKNPFFLSRGETKLIWLLTQWAKAPQFLVIGNLFSYLSIRKSNCVQNFLLNSDSIAQKFELANPTIILGQWGDISQYQSFLDHDKWNFINNWPTGNLITS